MKFLIQDNLVGEKQLLLVKDAVEKYPHEFIGLIPFTDKITSCEPLDGLDYIPYGSTNLTLISKEKGWKGLYFDLKQFNYDEALKNRDDMLNSGIIDVEEAIKFLAKEEDDSMWFSRPSEDMKQYAGLIDTASELRRFFIDAMKCASSGSYQLKKGLRVLLSKPKNIQCEWRWFIVDGKVVSGSMYRVKNQLRSINETDEAVINEAQEFADKWLPHPNCVMDLALVDDEVKVIEFNCINSSGFYAHDVKSVFDAIWKYEKGK
ncbi:MAG: ATP-grasp domain-containing protein [Candidatus Peribacteraceae bacterium]|nr:ATP-grasp domain-containing protein [Candidatus Peribacteraceae bacterium]